MKFPRPLHLAGLCAAAALGYLLAVSLTSRPAPAPPGSGGNTGQGQAAGVSETGRAPTGPPHRQLALLSALDAADAGSLQLIFTETRLSGDIVARDLAARRWAEVDPAGFLAHLKSLPSNEVAGMNEVPAMLFSTWSRRDPQAAFAAARAAERGEGFAGVRWAAISGMLEQYPELGFQLATGEYALPNDSAVPASAWEKDPSRFVKASAALNPLSLGELRNLQDARAKALAAWAGRDFPAASAWLQAQGTQLRAALMPKLIEKISATDPAQARAAIEAMPPSSERESSGRTIVKEWAGRDPQAALDWMDRNLTGGRGPAYRDWIAAVATADGFPKAGEWLQGLPRGNGRDQATETFTKAWADKDLPGALAWIHDLPDAETRHELLEKIMYSWSQKDQASLRKYLAEAPVGELPKSFNAYVLMPDRRPERAATLQWAMALPEDRRQMMMDSLVRQSTYGQDVGSATAVLENISDSGLRQRAALPIFESFLLRSPQDVLKFLETRPPDQLTGGTLMQFRKIVDSAPRLSPENKSEILAKLP